MFPTYHCKKQTNKKQLLVQSFAAQNSQIATEKAKLMNIIEQFNNSKNKQVRSIVLKVYKLEFKNELKLTALSDRFKTMKRKM